MDIWQSYLVRKLFDAIWTKGASFLKSEQVRMHEYTRNPDLNDEITYGNIELVYSAIGFEGGRRFVGRITQTKCTNSLDSVVTRYRPIV